MRILVILVLCLCVKATCAQDAGTPTMYHDPSWSPDGTHILFYSNRDAPENFEIYTLDLATGDIARLTTDDGDDVEPDWSPDGTTIAFNSRRSGPSEIYLMNTDGTGVRRLTDTGSAIAPAWSPDGKTLAFEGKGTADRLDVYLVAADGSNVRQLTTNEAFDHSPTWSPDGKRIAFASSRSGSYQVYVVGVAGGQPTCLTCDLPGQHHTKPDWSPDGSKILFSTVGGDATPGLYAMDADGSDAHWIVQNYYERDMAAAWSPDGLRIVYLKKTDEGLGIWVVNADGSEAMEVTRSNR